MYSPRWTVISIFKGGSVCLTCVCHPHTNDTDEGGVLLDCGCSHSYFPKLWSVLDRGLGSTGETSRRGRYLGRDLKKGTREIVLVFIHISLKCGQCWIVISNVRLPVHKKRRLLGLYW
jgi:hypothetical protein